jgi:signal transduction histidine kinase
VRRRISFLVLATTSAVVASFVIPLCLLVRTLAEDRAMAMADQEARNVAILVAGLDLDEDVRALVADLDEHSAPQTVVVTSEGEVIGGEASLTTDPEVTRAMGGQAFTVLDGDGGRVLLPVVTRDGTAVVRSRVSSEQLTAGVGRAWAGILTLGVVLMLGAWLIAARLGRRISEPLREVAGVAHALREGDLDARADVRGTEETQELARALNGLAERTTELLVAERAVVADLSHRLRTPVTALRLDAESVEQPELAARLEEHVAALQRTVDAIVKEARRPVRTDLAATCDAATTIRDRVAFWAVLAEDQGRRLTVRTPEGPVPVPLGTDDLADVVDVLVDNVFSHTHESTAFAVTLDVVGGEAVLAVTDTGMRRDPDVRRSGSTGLGLDIVQRTAQSVGGSSSFSSGPTGTRVEVRLPLRPGS